MLGTILLGGLIVANVAAFAGIIYAGYRLVKDSISNNNSTLSSYSPSYSTSSSSYNSYNTTPLVASSSNPSGYQSSPPVVHPAALPNEDDDPDIALLY